MIKYVLSAVFLVVLAVGGWWFFGRSSIDESDKMPLAQTSNAQTALDDEPDAAVEIEVPQTVTIVGQVTREDTKATVAGANIEIFIIEDAKREKCSLCGDPIDACTYPPSVQKYVQHLRGEPPGSVATVKGISDAQGRFEIELAQWVPSMSLSAKIVARDLRGFSYLNVDAENELLVAKPQKHVVQVTNESNEALSGIALTALNHATHEMQTAQTNADGKATIMAAYGEDLMVLAEATSFSPGAIFLSTPASEYNDDFNLIVLVPPKNLVVQTRSAGEPTDVFIDIEAHGAALHVKTKNGEWRIDNLGQDYVTVSVNDGSLTSAKKQVTLAARETTVVLDVMAATSLRVAVESQDGQPVPDVSATLTNELSSVPASPKAEGALIEFEQMPEGDYTLQISASDYINEAIQVSLVPGVNERQVVLHRAPTIEGTVTIEGGEKAPDDVSIVFESAEGRSVMANAFDGGFSGTVEIAGEYTIRAEHAVYGSAEAKAKAPSKNVSLVLTKKAYAEIELSPVPKADQYLSVSISQPNGRYVNALEVAGNGPIRRYQMSGMTPGKYQLRVDADFIVPIEKDIEVKDGPNVFRMQLETGEKVTGVVLTAEEVPVAGASVNCLNANAMTDEKGAFELGGLKRGKCMISVSDRLGNYTEPVEISVPGKNVKVLMKKSFQVKGRVVDERGVPVTDFYVNQFLTHSSNGSFQVATSESTLYVSFPDKYEGTDATVPPSHDVGVVVLKAYEKIAGEVFDTKGRPVSGAQVSAMGTNGVTNSGGQFELQPIQFVDGQVLVTASRGNTSAAMTVKQNQKNVRLVLEPSGKITGHVYAIGGAPVSVEVFANHEAGTMRTLRSNEAGQFEMFGARGIWNFSTYGFGGVQVNLTGESAEVSLGGDPEQCSLTVTTEIQVAVVQVTVDGKSFQGQNYDGRRTSFFALPCAAAKVSVYSATGFDSYDDATDAGDEPGPNLPQEFTVQLQKPHVLFAAPLSEKTGIKTPP
jgi:5-hydroxyisourate hydrolase-like protein (transthyretin family)